MRKSRFNEQQLVKIRRRQVDYAKRRGLSERWACALLSVARSTLRYLPRMPGPDAPALAAMVSLSAQYPRFGLRWEVHTSRRSGCVQRRQTLLRFRLQCRKTKRRKQRKVLKCLARHRP